MWATSGEQGLAVTKTLSQQRVSNMKAVAKAADTVERETRFDRIRPSYLEALMLVERLHCLA